MNASTQFILNGKQLTEAEFVEETLFSCYLAYSVVKEKKPEDVDIDICKDSINVIRKHLVKLEGLQLNDFQQMNVAHYNRFCHHYENEIHYRQQDDHKIKIAFCFVVCSLIVAIGVCLLLRG